METVWRNKMGQFSREVCKNDIELYTETSALFSYPYLGWLQVKKKALIE